MIPMDYRNLFRECGYAQADIDAKVEEGWMAIFEGPDRFYFESGPDGGYLLDTGNLDARTEGMSYGMMMAVQMDRKDVFDRLWKWSMDNMFMTSGLHAGYFAWSCKPDGTKNSRGPAPDGEEYYALSLFFASHRWGDGAAPYDYSVQARSLLWTCVHRGEDGIGFPMWNPTNRLIKFIPDWEFTDPSYHLPHFYELFALWADEADRPFWRAAASASREFLPRACHLATGLAPEYSQYDGTPETSRGHGNFYSDSYRVAANIGLDAAWWGVVPALAAIADRIQRFFADKDPADFREYSLDGTLLERKCLHPVGLIATTAMAGLAVAGPISAGANLSSAVSRFWETPLRTGDRRYYDNCLYLFALLALSGRYRVY